MKKASTCICLVTLLSGCITFSSELPIVVVDTLGIAVPDEPKSQAQMKIFYDPAGGRNVLDGSPKDFDGRIGIETRGNASQAYCQKQYGFETWDLSNNGVNVSLLQFPVEEDWVLHAPYADKSLLRNYLAYKTSNLIGQYASRTKFVEAFINDPGLARTGCVTPPPDDYGGVYILMEKIKRDSNRVNVQRLTALDNAEPEITGGYILKIDWPDATDVFFYTPARPDEPNPNRPEEKNHNPITYVYPKASTDPAENEITTQQKQWIRDYIVAFETALLGPSFRDPINGYAKYIDVDSFVDYFILNELFKNYDAYRASAYMYKDRNKKLKMGPIWDFNASMGNAYGPPWSESQGWILGNLHMQPFWWQKFLQDPSFVTSLKSRWQYLRAGLLTVQNLKAMIDTGATELAYAQVRHFNRWPILGTQVEFNPPPPANETFASNIQDLKAWIEARVNWIDHNILLLIVPASSPASPTNFNVTLH